MHKEMIKRLCLSALIATALPCVALAKPETVCSNRVAAMVNDHVISTTDLDARVRMALLSANMPNTPEARRELTPQVLDMMIEEALQRQMADKLKIVVDDARVDFAIQDIETRNNMTPGELLGTLQKEGVPARIMRDHLRASMAWVDYIRARYGDAVQVSAQDVERRVDELKTARTQPHVRLAEIILPNDEKGRTLASKLANQLRAGAPFPALAAQFSHAGSAARGGDRGWVSVNRLDEKVRASLESVSAGSVSAPIETVEGIALYLVRDKRAAGESLQKDTFITFQQALFPAPRGASQEALYPIFLRAKSLTNNAKSCPVMKKLIQNGSGRLQEMNKVSVGNLPGQLKDFLDKLSLGKASEPIFTDMGFIVFMVCDRQTIDPADPTTDEIQEMLRSQELNNIAQRELRKLRSAAFVDIRL